MVAHSDDDHLPIMSVADESGVVVSTTAGHARRLGRSLSDVVGHSCREWCLPSDWDASLAYLQATIGRHEPRTWKRVAVSENVQAQLSWITTTPLIAACGKRLALCSIVSAEEATVVEATATKRVAAFDVATYTEDMLRGLADLAQTGGLPKLQSSLEMIAGEVARLVAELRRTFN